MGIMLLIKKIFPEMSGYILEDLQKVRQPRYMLAGDIGHWIDLRGQINAATGRINSYRDIRKICAAEDKTVPSLGTLRNYLGEGGEARHFVAEEEWKEWYADFGRIAGYYEDEMKGLTTKDQWEEFNIEYHLFMGY